MLRLLSVLAGAAVIVIENLITAFYRTPLFRGRCASSGRDLVVQRVPQVLGHTRIDIGNNVRFAGLVGIASGRTLDHPRLIIGDGVTISDLVNFSVNREVIVEAGVSIGAKCYIADNDGHPREAAARASGAAPGAEDVVSIRICRNAKVGYGSYIMKGVTIGEGAIIQPRSVVSSDIPPQVVAGGSPARVVPPTSTR
jgi:acetyltransferase-like isoleucine patch superfamily enzyme